MPAFSKVYYSKKDNDFSLTVTWDTGYRNVQIFHKGRLVHTIPHPSVLLKGIEYRDNELGIILIEFTSNRPRKLNIYVNAKKLITINKKKLGYDYTGLIASFWTLAFLSVIGLLLFLGQFDFNINHPVLITTMIIDIVIILIYGTTALLLGKRLAWAYFIGTATYTFTSIIAINHFMSLTMHGLFDIAPMAIRVALLIYLLSQVKNIVTAMKSPKKGSDSSEILDEPTSV